MKNDKIILIMSYYFKIVLLSLFMIF